MIYGHSIWDLIVSFAWIFGLLCLFGFAIMFFTRSPVIRSPKNPPREIPLNYYGIEGAQKVQDLRNRGLHRGVTLTLTHNEYICDRDVWGDFYEDMVKLQREGVVDVRIKDA